MAAPSRASVLTRVLVRVLALNIAVAFAKLALGYATGALSIISDGFHSLTDGASNVMGLVATRAARKPPDDDHPYGHRKYETLAAAGIFVFLLLVVIEVVQGALGRLRGTAPRHRQAGNGQAYQNLPHVLPLFAQCAGHGGSRADAPRPTTENFCEPPEPVLRTSRGVEGQTSWR